MGVYKIPRSKSRSREATLFLAIAAGIFCACYCILSMANNYYVARYNLDAYAQDAQGWDACRQTEPGYYRANTDAVNSCLKNLDTARENFWVNLSTVQLAGLFVLAGLGGAAGGYLSIWAIIWLGSSAIGKSLKWLGLCADGNDSGHLENLPCDCQVHRTPDGADQQEPARM